MNKEANVHRVSSDKGIISECIKSYTEEKSWNIGDLMPYDDGHSDYWATQHLYVTTDEEIKEGDKILDLKSNEILTCVGINEDGRILVAEYKNVSASKDVVRKITATTDPKLIIETHPESMTEGTIYRLPQILQSFIEEYCKAGGIDKVLVETVGHYVLENSIGVYSRHNQAYTPIYFSRKGNPIVFSDRQSAIDEGKMMPLNTLLDAKCVYVSKPKTDSNNCIIIHPVEEKMYSKEEMIDFAKYAIKNGFGLNHTENLFDKWIKENL